MREEVAQAKDSVCLSQANLFDMVQQMVAIVRTGYMIWLGC